MGLKQCVTRLVTPMRSAKKITCANASLVILGMGNFVYQYATIQQILLGARSMAIVLLLKCVTAQRDGKAHIVIHTPAVNCQARTNMYAMLTVVAWGQTHAIAVPIGVGPYVLLQFVMVFQMANQVSAPTMVAANLPTTVFVLMVGPITVAISRFVLILILQCHQSVVVMVIAQALTIVPALLANTLAINVISQFAARMQNPRTLVLLTVDVLSIIRASAISIGLVCCAIFHFAMKYQRTLPQFALSTVIAQLQMFVFVILAITLVKHAKSQFVLVLLVECLRYVLGMDLVWIQTLALVMLANTLVTIARLQFAVA